MSRRATLLAAIALFAAIPARAEDPAPATAAAPTLIPPSLEQLFRPAQYAGMKISPDGRRVAALVPINGRRNLAILELSPRSAKPVTAFDRYDVIDFQWINDKRLLLTLGAASTMVSSSRSGAGFFAIDLDGTSPRFITQPRQTLSDALSARATARSVIPMGFLDDGSDKILAQEFVFRLSPPSATAGGFFRYDTRTGEMESLSESDEESERMERWIVDSNGVPRVRSVTSKGRVTVRYRSGAGAPWTMLDDHAATEPPWAPRAIGEDGKTIVLASTEGGDRLSLRSYDPEARKAGETLAEHPRVDLANVIVERGRALGVLYNDERPAVAWFDRDLARAQAAVDRALEGTVNVLSWSRDRSRFVIRTFSDVSQGSYYLLDAKAGKLEWLADAAPWLKADELSPKKPVRYRARDGLEIPAYLTLPRGSAGKKLPLIVHVHGGPWEDGASWGYDPEVQLFASRGYAVLQPNFRGTTRYGWKHFRASFGEWGRAMQDDLEDGVRWAVERGVADPDRVCIYGASYGGYAAMMGLVRTPKLYRCGVNAVGVTDLNLFMDGTGTDYANTDAFQYSMAEMMGDRARFDAVSPVLQAERIEAPVLMAYGTEDRRVPLEHGQRMKAALEKHGKSHLLMVMQGEGHGFRSPVNVGLFYQAVLAFFEKNLKPAEAKPEPAGKLP